MAKPKVRYFEGVKLAEHLYPAPGRPGAWRYKRPDHTYKRFLAADVHQANRIAEENNALRHTARLDRSSMAYAVPIYIAHAERLRPSLKGKQSWYNRTRALINFAKVFPLRTVTEREIWTWWDSLTHSQQILREAEFRRLWTWLLRENYVTADTNPFDRDRLLRREKPVSLRERLTLPDFWKVYAKAEDGIQVAMGISLLTTLRRGDVCGLRRTHVQGDFLRVTVSKSEEQRGVIKAARLEWDLGEHQELGQLVERGLRLGQISACPFVVNMKPKSNRGQKEHGWQVLPNRLSKEFAGARRKAQVGGEHPPTFHEIRSLGSALLAKQGEDITDVMTLMAHSEEEITRLYQSGHSLPHQRIGIRIQDAGGKW